MQAADVTQSLRAAARITATNTGTGVDVSAFQGLCKVVLNSSATEGADHTSDAKLQHSDTLNGTYADVTGGAFAQVTNAAASHQELLLNADNLKKFVRVVNTLAGTSPAVTYAVSIVGKRQST